MSKVTTTILRVLIAIFFAFALLMQFFALPGIAMEVLKYAREFSHVLVPYIGSASLAFICVEVVLVALWVLLGMAQHGSVFSEKAFRWVNVIIWAAGIATALAVFVIGIMVFVPNSAAGGSFIIMLLLSLGGAAFALLMTVMRALLRQATDAKAELEEVI